jgi:DNA-binding NarL/FixJ family response regulator
MGEAAPVRWNSVPQTRTTRLREQPAWTYYSQVSVASPHGLVNERQEASMVAATGTLTRSRFHPSPIPASVSFERQDVQPALGTPKVCDGKEWGPWSLTQRELEVIQLLAEGATNSEMSERLFISPKTTKNHLAAIFQKLDVTNRTQALVRAVVMGLVTIE